MPNAEFKREWFLLPGITLIRRAMLKPLKAEAERRFTGGQEFKSNSNRR